MVSAPQPPPDPPTPNKVVTRSKGKKDTLSLQFLIEGHEREAKLRRQLNSLEATNHLVHEWNREHWMQRGHCINKINETILKIRKLESDLEGKLKKWKQTGQGELSEIEGCISDLTRIKEDLEDFNPYTEEEFNPHI